MNGLTISTMKARLTLSSNNIKRHEGNITTDAEVVNHFLRPCTADNVISNAHEKIKNFKQGLLTPWHLSQKI